MIDRATEILDNHENSVSRSESSTASVTTTPYNSSRDSSGSHSPTTDPTQLRTGAPSGASSQPSTSSSMEGGDSEMETDSTPATPHITVSSADQATGKQGSNCASFSPVVFVCNYKLFFSLVICLCNCCKWHRHRNCHS